MLWLELSVVALNNLREVDVHLHVGLDVVSAFRKAGISDKPPHGSFRRF